MGLKKCPRCELNYILDGEKYCTVCRREIKGEPDRDTVEMCPICNENPVMPGKDMCVFCMKELGRTEPGGGDDLAGEAEEIEIGSVSGMDEIAMDIDGDIPARELGEIDRELSLDEALKEEGGDEEDEEDD
jgi:hypothetical protein